jgi:MOSC domain-containing protein YiiM
MTKVGNIISLFYSTVNNGCTPSTELFLDEKGICDDKHYNTNIDRSVLLTSLDSYKLTKSANIDISHGLLGENLLIDYNPYHLTTGQKLQIGLVVLEISQHCTLCKGFAKLDSKLPKLLKDDRGIFAKVLKSGTIKVDDVIYLLD